MAHGSMGRRSQATCAKDYGAIKTWGSAAEVLQELAENYPDSVHSECSWLDFVRQNVTRDLALTGAGPDVLIRQSRFEDGDGFLIVNASEEPVMLGISAIREGEATVLNPWDGASQPLGDAIHIEGWNARMVTVPR